MVFDVGKTAENAEAAETNSIPADGEGTRMVLWTRRPVCGPRTEVIDRLSRLTREDAITEFTVETWPDEVVLSEHTDHTRVVEQYGAFKEWAGDNDVSLTPAFERRTVSPLVGKRREVLTIPMLCLAVYRDDLCGVYPCNDGERTWRVTDYLDAFESTSGRLTDSDSGLPLG